MLQRLRNKRWDKWLGGLLALGWGVFLLFSWRGWLTSSPSQRTAPAVKPISHVQANQPMQLVVYVLGAVNKPGLYRLPLDSRLVDALQAAGGATKLADLQAVNLAAIVEDGTEIVIPAVEARTGAAVQALSAGKATTSRKKVQPGERIPVNQAGLAALEQLPGIGAKKAQAIFDYRHVHGDFTDLAQLAQVKGIGPALLTRIEPYLTLR